MNPTELCGQGAECVFHMDVHFAEGVDRSAGGKEGEEQGASVLWRRGASRICSQGHPGG